MTINVPPNQLAETLEAETNKQIAEIFNKTFEEIVDRTPVLSGTLKAGWKKDDNTIWNDVEYAGFVELGTSSHAPAAMVDTTLNDLDFIVAEVLR